jgi:hypothetical protein
MRPTGGVLGGMPAFEGGNEYQGHGTPHYHGQGHVVCIYQFESLYEIAQKIQDGMLATKDMKDFHEWQHVERPFDSEMHKAYVGEAEKNFFEGHKAPEHAPLCQTPAFLQEDADQRNGNTLSAAYSNPELLPQIEREGEEFAQQYRQDAQFVFSRVQHHIHKRCKDGSLMPLNACAKKRKKGKKAKLSAVCKHDFPKSNVITDQTVLICQGLAKKFKLRVTGRRNAYGLLLGRRPEEWQSGTTPALAVHFRSNSHTMPNYRIPPVPAAHEECCPSATCALRTKAMLDGAHNLLDKATIKGISRLAQRVQREATGYYCGYTFKGQVVGRKYILQAVKSLDYLTTGLQDKTEGQRLHRITNRVFTDIHHRCMARPAAEEWTLPAFSHEQDVTNAEFIRT